MEDHKKPFAPTFFLWLGIAMCVWAVVRLWPDRSYYFLPVADRALSPHHETLRSSGLYGLSFGAIGTILLFVNLTYLIRKKFISIEWLGSLRSWMAFHVFTGLVAGAMVLLHSTFLLRSALGTMAFWSMIIVLVTGLLGRLIYAHSPRSLKGNELELEQIRINLEAYSKQLAEMGMPVDCCHMTEQQVIKGSDKGFIAALFAMIIGDRVLKREQAALRELVLSQPRLMSLSCRILPLADRYCQERQWATRYQELRALMGGWRFLHRWIAILLLVVVAAHILVAFQMGDLWLADYFKRLISPHRATALVAAPPAPKSVPAVAAKRSAPSKKKPVKKPSKARTRRS